MNPATIATRITARHATYPREEKGLLEKTKKCFNQDQIDPPYRSPNTTTNVAKAYIQIHTDVKNVV